MLIFLPTRNTAKCFLKAFGSRWRSASLSEAVLSFSTAAQMKPIPAPVDSVPTILELSDNIRLHAARVYKGHGQKFDPTWEHEQSVGTQHAIIPLSTRREPFLRTCSENKKAFVLGVIFEEADILATYIGYKHNQNPSIPIGTPAHHTIGIVTGRVERVDIVPNAEFREDQDILLSGFVSWLGKSSMEVTITAKQQDSSTPDGFRDLLVSRFIMVSVTPDFKGAPNVPLKLYTDDQRKMFDEGEAAKNARAIRDKTSIASVGPTPEEYAELRQLTNKTLDPFTLSDRGAQLADGHVWVENATARAEAMCYPIQTNLHGYVFGGYLISEAFDIAWINTARLCKRRPQCIGVTNVLFPKPVAVNSILCHNSQVCYTDGRYAQVAVDTSVKDLKTGKHMTTNTFHFTFDTLGELPAIMPRTYSDCLRYLNSKREYNYCRTGK